MLLDGNLLDMLSVSCGAVAILIKPFVRHVRKIEPIWVHRDAVNDFLNATSVAPFALLLATPFNSWALMQITAGGKAFLAMAGGVGLMFVLKELFSIVNGLTSQTPDV